MDTITGLAPGVYDLRNKGDNQYIPSDTVQAVIGSGAEQTHIVAVTKCVPSPASDVPFGPQPYRYKPNSAAYTLKNVGNSTVTNLTVWLSGDSDFSIRTQPSKTLPVTDETTVIVDFGSARSVGDYTCALQYSCDQCTISTIPLANITQTIIPFDLGSDGAEIDAIPSQSYTGNPITPRPAVKIPADTLLHDQYYLDAAHDFTVDYFDNNKVGTAYATAYGKGNFTGMLTAEFTITGHDVTLDANGGTIEGGGTKVFQNRADIPPLEDNVPYKDGHAFDGWYYVTQPDKQAHTGETISADTILSAKWIDGDYTLSVNPAKGDFGSVEFGYTTPPDAQTFTLTNTGSSTIDGFSVTGSTNNFMITYTSAAIDRGAKATFTVQPKTGLAEGEYADTITVFTAHSPSSALTLPVTFTVKSSPIAVSPKEADFGAAPPDYPSPPADQTFYITYTGDGTFDLQEPTGAADYIISGLSRTELNAEHPTATFTVHPKLGLSEGVYNEMIAITGETRTTTFLGRAFALLKRARSADKAVRLTAPVKFTVSSSISAPVITTQPSNATVPAGSPATYTVAATGNPTPSYQWQQWDKVNQIWIDLPCVESTYTTEHLSAAQHGTKFRCRVWNYTSQENVVYSSIVTVSVNSLRIAPAGRFIVGNAPADLTLHIGEDGHAPSTGDFGSLGIALDGDPGVTPVDPGNYDVTYSSIHLTLHQDWLNTLPPGTHTLQVTLAGNYANTPVLTIPLIITTQGSGDGSSNVPETGDSARPWLWCGVLLLSAGGFIASAARRRRKRKAD